MRLASLKKSTSDAEKHEIIEQLNAVSGLLIETLSDLKDDISLQKNIKSVIK